MSQNQFIKLLLIVLIDIIVALLLFKIVTSYPLAKGMVTVQYVSLCNLIANNKIVPELLQSAANVANMVVIFDEIYNDQAAYVRMRCELDAVVKMMGAFEPKLLHQALVNCLD